MEANWLVLQSESSDDYGPHLIAATPFKELDAAKEYLKHVLNDEWDMIEPTTGGASLRLGDNPGYKYPENSSIRKALIYFDDEGREAWNMVRLEKKIKIVYIAKEGERTC